MAPIIVTEIGMPFTGWYIATRRKDGALYVRINMGAAPVRKWVRPSKVQFKEEYSEVFIDKYTDLVTHND